MVYLTQGVSILISILSIAVYLGLAIICFSKWVSASTEETYAQDYNFRALWYLFFLSIIIHLASLIINLIFFITHNEFWVGIRYIFFSSWAYEFINVELQILILISNLIPAVKLSESNIKRKNITKLHYLHIIPIFLILTVLLFAADYLKSSNYVQSVLIGRLVGFNGLLAALVNGVIVYFIRKRFNEFINIIEEGEGEVIKFKNRTTIYRWRIFLWAIIVYAIFYTIVEVIFFLELQKVKPFFVEDEPHIKNGYFLLQRNKIPFMILRLYSALIVVFISPYSYIQTEAYDYK